MAPPSGDSGFPGDTFPDRRLLPKVPVVPWFAVLLKAMSLFNSRTEPALCTPMLLWLIVELLTMTCAPESPLRSRSRRRTDAQGDQDYECRADEPQMHFDSPNMMNRRRESCRSMLLRKKATIPCRGIMPAARSATATIAAAAFSMPGAMASNMKMPEHQHSRQRQGGADGPAGDVLDVVIAGALDHIGSADVGSPMM